MWSREEESTVAGCVEHFASSRLLSESCSVKGL